MSSTNIMNKIKLVEEKIKNMKEKVEIYEKELDDLKFHYIMNLSQKDFITGPEKDISPIRFPVGRERRQI